MFQTSPLSCTQEDLIRTISPLVPLNPNACPRFSLQMASLGQTSSDTSKYSYKRAVNNPLFQRKPYEERNRRRQAFLDKVRQASADKTWESRSEQVRGRNEWDSSMTRSGWHCNRSWERISSWGGKNGNSTKHVPRQKTPRFSTTTSAKRSLLQWKVRVLSVFTCILADVLPCRSGNGWQVPITGEPRIWGSCINDARYCRSRTPPTDNIVRLRQWRGRIQSVNRGGHINTGISRAKQKHSWRWLSQPGPGDGYFSGIRTTEVMSYAFINFLQISSKAGDALAALPIH